MELKDDGTAVFTIDILGNLSKESYKGIFRVKCLLSPLEQIRADKQYREMLGNNHYLAVEHVRQQAYALSELEQRITVYPPFWENEEIGGGHIPDNNVILEIFELAIEAQEKFKEEKEKELKERQKLLTRKIKTNKIKEPEQAEEAEEEEEAPEIEL